ncbi:MAG: nucleotide exchange factor GrpE [Deltaproteobacteria bacterium]|jgi:molecular chaperone GrpE|nr:nucleotide exchange factor GrpE [Deltaproteobacteria bacterium]
MGDDALKNDPAEAIEAIEVGPGATEQLDGTLSDDQVKEPIVDAGPPDWQDEAKRFEDLYLRSMAELDNTRRRYQKEKAEILKFASERVLVDMLPFLDNLYLALDYADRENPSVRSLAEGLDMTLKGCLDKLSEHGLREVPVVLGQQFNPYFQEAIGQEPDPNLADLSICRLVSRGYTLHDRLIRPAKVIVVKNPV